MKWADKSIKKRRVLLISPDVVRKCGLKVNTFAGRGVDYWLDDFFYRESYIWPSSRLQTYSLSLLCTKIVAVHAQACNKQRSPISLFFDLLWVCVRSCDVIAQIKNDFVLFVISIFFPRKELWLVAFLMTSHKTGRVLKNVRLTFHKGSVRPDFGLMLRTSLIGVRTVISVETGLVS